MVQISGVSCKIKFRFAIAKNLLVLFSVIVEIKAKRDKDDTEVELKAKTEMRNGDELNA